MVSTIIRPLLRDSARSVCSGVAGPESLPMNSGEMHLLLDQSSSRLTQTVSTGRSMDSWLEKT